MPGCPTMFHGETGGLFPRTKGTNLVFYWGPVTTVRFFKVTSLGIYRWLVTFGSARWLIEILSAILKSTRHGGQSIERL